MKDDLIIYLLKICKKNWLWFFFSSLLFLGLAVLYLNHAPKVYLRSTALMIKEETPMRDVQAAFTDRPLYSGINVNNEIEAFKSPHLLNEVIARLNLTTNYISLDGFRKFDLYDQSPIRVLFLDANADDDFSFLIESLSDNSLMLSSFERWREKYNFRISAQLYDTISTPFGRMIITSAEFDPHHPWGTIQIVKHNALSLLSQMTGQYEVYLSSKLNKIIILEFKDVSIQRADDVLHTMIEVYNENWLNENNQEAKIAKMFFDERIPVIEMELREVEDQLEKFKSAHQITDIHSASNLDRQISADYSKRIVEVRNQIEIAGYLRDYMKNNANSYELLPSGKIGLTDASIESQIILYNNTMIKRNELIPHAGERNPRIMDMNTQLNAMKKSILQSVENYLAGLQLQLSGFQTQESKVTQNIASNPGQEKLLTSIEREHQLKQALYLHLLQKREENEMTLVIANTNTRIISSPFGSPYPVKPNRYSIFLVALFLGFSIPGGLVVGRELINATIRDQNELDVLPVPLLGIIPKAKDREKNRMLLVQEYGEGQMNEAFRFLRTKLMSVCSPDTKVIQVTSMESGSGKTFLALNLAMSFAVAGKKVVLLDLDMRKATLSRLIGNPEFGIFHLLANMVLHERYFVEKNYFYSGFDILPTGPLPLSPSELLMSDSLEKLLQRYRTTYDYIFIDSPPVDLVTDADIIAHLSDSSIFVLRENFTERRKLIGIKKIYKEERFKNMRVVLNGSIAENHLDKYYDDHYKKIKILPKADAHEIIPKTRYLT